MTPEFIDPTRGYSRIYVEQDVKAPACGEPKYEFIDSKKTIPIDQMAGHVCLPTAQAQEIIRYYNQWQKSNAKCPNIIDEQLFLDEINHVRE